jgi:hypothetical protein
MIIASLELAGPRVATILALRPRRMPPSLLRPILRLGCCIEEAGEAVTADAA